MFRSVFRFSALAFVVILLALGPRTGICQQKEKLALGLAPESTSFYTSSINHDKLIMRVLNSNAWSNLVGSDGPRQYLGMLQGMSQAFDLKTMLELEGDESALAEYLVDPDNAKEVQELGMQIVSTEIFAFGDENFPRIVQFFRAGMTRTWELAGEKAVGIEDFASALANEEIAQIYKDLLSNEFSDLQFPGVVVGGRIQDPELAGAVINEMDPFIRKDLAMLPESLKFLEAGYSLVVQDDRTLLTLKFKMSDLPWDVIDERIADENLDPETLKLIREGLGDREISVAIGNIGDHFIVAMGGGADFVENLGEGSSLLEVAELDPLNGHWDKQLTSVYYTSDELAKSSPLSMYTDGSEQAFKLAIGEILSQEGVEVNDEIVSAFDDVMDQVGSLFPEQGAMLRFSYLTENSIEGYQYDYGEVVYLDGSKPLSITNHVGGSPAMVYASRFKNREKFLDVLNAFITLSETFEGTIDTEARRESERVLREIYDIAESKLFPSTNDGQMAFVLGLDGTPVPPLVPGENEIDLRTPELAIVMGISDRELFLESMDDFWQLADMQSIVDAQEDMEIVLDDLDGAQLFSVDLGDDITGAIGLLPSLLVEDDFAAMTLGQGHTERIYSNSPLDLFGDHWDLNQPACQIFLYDNVQVVAAVEGWGTMAVQFYLAMMGGEIDEPTQKTVGHLVEFLKAYKGYSSITREGENGLVTQFIYRFEDSISRR